MSAQWGSSPNFFESYYGNGLGVGQQQSNTQAAPLPQTFGGGAGNQSSGYVPPSPQTQRAQNQSMTDSDWMDLARFGYSVYRDRNPPKPNFEPTPLGPEEKQIYELYLKNLMNPATQNNVAALNEIASRMLGGLSNMSWQSPRTFSGDVGYAGSSMSFDPRSAFRPSGPQGNPGGPPMDTGGGDVFPSPGREDSPLNTAPTYPGGGLMPPVDVTGRPWAGQYEGSSFFGNDPNFMSHVARAAGPRGNEETWERWISRGLSLLLGAAGLPIPPNLLDRGIDGVQAVYRRFFGSGGDQSQSPFDQFYGTPPGTPSQFGSAYRPNQRPPGMSNQPPRSGYGPSFGGGAGTPFGDFGAPGSVLPPPPQQPQTGYRIDPRTGIVTTADGRYAGGGDFMGGDSVLVPFGGGSFPGGGPRFVLPQHPSSEPISATYAQGFIY